MADQESRVSLVEASALESELYVGLLDNLHVAGDRLLRPVALLDGRRVSRATGMAGLARLGTDDLACL